MSSKSHQPQDAKLSIKRNLPGKLLSLGQSNTTPYPLCNVGMGPYATYVNNMGWMAPNPSPYFQHPYPYIPGIMLPPIPQPAEACDSETPNFVTQAVITYNLGGCCYSTLLPRLSISPNVSTNKPKAIPESKH